MSIPASSENADAGLLTGYRLLDLTDDRGYFCGRLLADLGADVVKIEPPEGDPGRRRGPFFHGVPHPERSLTFWAYNVNKQSITLELTQTGGRMLFEELARRSDAVIESFNPGYLDSLGLGYERLSDINPRIVLTSISAFGQTGPYRDYQASDLVVQALGGLMALAGDPDRPPVSVSVPQAYLQAAAEGAVGTVLALHHAGVCGQGQRVDVSAQQAVVWSLMNAVTTWDLKRVNIERSGSRRMRPSGLRARLIWACADGHVVFNFFGGRVAHESLLALARWMAEAGEAPDYLVPWLTDEADLETLAQEQFDLLEAPVEEFFRQRAKQELYEEALKRRIMLYPVSTAADLVSNAQLQSRGFFQPLRHEELGRSVTYPGPFADVQPAAIRLRSRPPLIGEHNREVYGDELGLSDAELALLKSARVI